MRDRPAGPITAAHEGGLWLLALGIATIFGGLSVLLLKVGLGLAGSPLTWAQALAGLPDWYVWALLVPLVVALARAFPLDHDRWGVSLAVHVPLGLGVALAELYVFTAVNMWYNRTLLGLEYPSFGSTYLTVVARWLPLALLIYALIVAVVTAVDHARRAREQAVAAAHLETELVRAKAHALQAQIRGGGCGPAGGGLQSAGELECRSRPDGDRPARPGTPARFDSVAHDSTDRHEPPGAMYLP